MIRGGLDHRFVRFLAVGGLTAVLYLGVSHLVLNVLGLEYRLGISVAYFVAVAFHFFCNRRYTFAAHDDGLVRAAARYCCVLAVNYAITLAVAVACVRLLGLAPFGSSAVSMFVTTALTFLLLSRWVFKAK